MNTTISLFRKQKNFFGLAAICVLGLVLLCVPSSTVYSSSSSGSSSSGGNFIDFDPPRLEQIAPLNSVEYGRCIERFLWIDIPGFPASKHHDVYFRFDTLNVEYIRGFFAKSTFAAIRQATAYLAGKEYYIKGEVKNVANRNGVCNMQDSAYPWAENLSAVPTNPHQERYERFRTTMWTKFHIVTRNCQKWADEVLK